MKVKLRIDANVTHNIDVPDGTTPEQIRGGIVDIWYHPLDSMGEDTLSSLSVDLGADEYYIEIIDVTELTIGTMIEKCKEVDFENLGINGFQTTDDINDFYRMKSPAVIMAIYKQYFGKI